MSRIGRLPIEVPQGVAVTVTPHNVVEVKGPLGELKTPVDKNITVTVDNGHVLVKRQDDEKKNKAKHGLYRTLIANNIEGVTKGYTKELTA